MTGTKILVEIEVSCNSSVCCSKFRKAAYNALDYLVETVGNTVPTDMHQKLFVIILEDISPEKQYVVLSVSPSLKN